MSHQKWETDHPGYKVVQEKDGLKLYHHTSLGTFAIVDGEGRSKVLDREEFAILRLYLVNWVFNIYDEARKNLEAKEGTGLGK